MKRFASVALIALSVYALLLWSRDNDGSNVPLVHEHAIIFEFPDRWADGAPMTIGEIEFFELWRVEDAKTMAVEFIYPSGPRVGRVPITGEACFAMVTVATNRMRSSISEVQCTPHMRLTTEIRRVFSNINLMSRVSDHRTI